MPSTSLTPETPASAATGNSSAPGATFFGHPRGLATLFLTEMWERFSFYGMRALLALFLVTPVSHGGMGFALATGAAVYSVYNAMVYLLTLPGGWVADRLWGPKKTVAVAGGVIMVGHFLLAVPMTATFFVGLCFIAAGSGLLKANISTMVGHLYPDRTDARRDSAFTIFYIGINLGSFFAPLAIGTVGQQVDWHLGFALAGIGMALGLVIYLIGGRSLAAESDVVTNPLPRAERNAVLRKSGFWAALAAVFYAVVLFTGSFTVNWVIWPLTVLGLVLPVLLFVRIKRDRDLDTDEQKKMSGYIWIFVAAALFWMIYDQSGSTLNVFAADSTKGTLWGFHFPSTWFQSLNPLYIMALAPVFAWLWMWLKGRNPSTMTKFSLGLLGIGISFGVMMMAQAAAAGGVKVTPLWLALVYLVQTVAELCLSPVGLSVTTRLAPRKYSSQMMGIWFLAVTAGDCVAALIQQVMGSATGGEVYFAIQGAMAVAAGVAVFFARGRIKRLMGDVH
ncbi:MFS transporter [Mangrovactinospora gilvigrisea]|uniref:MFS transporter n=1 Tax=Mangrovactinospora gilvigrisea TaxID=1428644 RepID=A0A1J7BIU9_9ACTN|nr:oligopeptide:H+ symporter [Mangrovactinospora gilvigrisea]OIV38599.1 MFS transporter [Mangrovactinospora gilvigrisea]